MPSKFRGIKEFMTFSKSERNGIIFLIFLILLLIFAPIFYKSFVRSISSENDNFYAKADSFFSSITLKPDVSIKSNEDPIENEEIKAAKEIKYFFFDPNTASIEDMVQLGLSVKQANVVEKYRSKGGRFSSLNDFSKIYVIDSDIFLKLKPWIKINALAADSALQHKRDSIRRDEMPFAKVELNTADTLELERIKGVNRVIARRIVAYRNLLGGFISTNQLTEVYGIKTEWIKIISLYTTVDSTRVNKINLNLVSFEDIKKHPYLSEYQAKAIIFYRSKVGNIKDTKELLLNKILSFDKYSRIKSYLTAY